MGVLTVIMSFTIRLVYEHSEKLASIKDEITEYFPPPLNRLRDIAKPYHLF